MLLKLCNSFYSSLYVPVLAKHLPRFPRMVKMQYLKITVLCGKQDLTADVPYTIPVYNNYNVAYSPLLGVYFVTFVLL